MDFNHYDIEIQNIVNNILDYRRHDSTKVLKYCRKLIRHAKTANDSYLFGFAYYYMCEAYFSFNSYSKFMNCLIKAITFQQEAKQDELLARSYNMLAISADSQGNLISSLDHYLTALSYCQKCNLTYERGLVYTNLGHLYEFLKDYRTAIRYFRLGLSYFEHEKTNQFYYTNVVLNYSAIGNCYYNLNREDRFMRYMQNAELIVKNHQIKEYSTLSFLINKIRLLHHEENYIERDQLIEHTIPFLIKASQLLDIYREIFDFCNQLLLYKKFDALWQVLNHLEALTQSSGVTNLQLLTTELKMQYYELVNDNDNYLKCTAEYFRYSKKLEQDERETAITTINLRFTLEEIRSKTDLIVEENRILQERSERDSLTGLPNRYRLNDYGDEALERAYKNQTSLAVEIFDIDCFKQYNDTYGHPAGDQCLCEIATQLKNLLTNKIFCARYGGDEFVLIYEDMTDEQILAFAEHFKKTVEDLKIAHKNSTTAPYVTISQGIRNSVPSDGNKIWDYLFAADAALYSVKRDSKSGIQLVHKTTPKSDGSNMIQYINN